MKREPSDSIDPRLVRALGHPLRARILEILTERSASPTWLSDHLEKPLSHIAYHTRTLDECDCLDLVDTSRRRGATEHFYKARPGSFIGGRGWRKVPRSVRGGVVGAALQTFMDRAVSALEAGTIDRREESVVGWMPLHLDRRGWEEVTAIVEEATDEVLVAEKKSRARLARAKGKKESICAIVAGAAFETGDSRAA